MPSLSRTGRSGPLPQSTNAGSIRMGRAEAIAALDPEGGAGWSVLLTRVSDAGLVGARLLRPRAGLGAPVRQPIGPQLLGLALRGRTGGRTLQRRRGRNRQLLHRGQLELGVPVLHHAPVQPILRDDRRQLAVA